MRKVLPFFLFVLIGISMSACQWGKDVPLPTMIPTAPLPTRIAATLTPSSGTLQNKCQNSFYFVADYNYADGIHVERGQTFLKEWEVINNGNCDWEEGFKLRFVSGDMLHAKSAVPIPAVRVGKKGIFSIEFIAPDEPGVYRSIWKAFGEDNRSFGDTVFVEINVY